MKWSEGRKREGKQKSRLWAEALRVALRAIKRNFMQDDPARSLSFPSFVSLNQFHFFNSTKKAKASWKTN